ncbi:hypothetical protein B7486_57865 [cyanobacterium TDX16]|nr:hypothetical protein B7486_57865 [cyanobacterium TDX16]
MPMVGSAAEYERLALAALRKAGTDGSDPTYHNARAHIYATLAIASASEASARRARKAAKSSSGDDAKALPAGTGSSGT